MQEREAPSRRDRDWPLEYLRILAAFGVVWFHCGTKPPYWSGPAALWVFVLISFTLLAHAVPNKPTVAFAAAKVRRVLMPWLFWSTVYLLLGLWRLWRRGTPFYENWMLFTGFSLHLWYLPYLFAASVALYWARRSSAVVDRPAGTLLIALSGLVLIAANGLWRPDGPPLLPWVQAVPMTLLGYALGRITLLREDLRRRVAGTALVVGVTAICLARIFVSGRHELDGVAILVGLGVFLAVKALPLPAWAPVGSLASLTLGIYLIHPIVRDLFVKVIGESGSAFCLVTVFAASAVAVYGMGKIPVLRSLV